MPDAVSPDRRPSRRASPAATLQRGTSAMTFDLKAYLGARRALVDDALGRNLDALARTPPALIEAMRYSLMAGGKRLRPILALASCEAVGAPPETALDVACALEFI